MIILVGGYAFSALRHTAIGCSATVRWSKRVNRNARFILVLVALVPFIPVFNLCRSFCSICAFEPDEAVAMALLWVAMGLAGYVYALASVMKTGDHNGRIAAEHSAKRCYRNCQIACEYADWGETVLDCCQNPHCLNCPLAQRYQIRTILHPHDVLEALYREERRERQMRRRGEPVPTAVAVSVPFERVLTKGFDAEGWHDGFEDLFRASQKPVDVTPVVLDSGCNVIPFPGAIVSSAAQPASTPAVAEPANPEVTSARRGGLKKLALNFKDRGLLVQDCGSYILLRLKWLDEDGHPHFEEHTLEKSAEDYPYVLRSIAALDGNAAKQLAEFATPVETV